MMRTKLLLLLLLLSSQVSAQVGITGAIMINRGRPVTNNPRKEVFLNLMARGAKYMMISNNGSFIGSKWQPFEAVFPKWKLSGMDGRKTVYAQFKDASGNLSEVVSAEIELDRIPPRDPSVMIDGGRYFSNRKDRLVRLDFDVIDGYQMRVSNRYDFLGAPWITFRKRIPKWRLAPRTGKKTIYVQFRDRAGNVSEVATSDINLDYIPPTQCAIKIENGALYTNSRLVKINVHAKDATFMTFKGGPGWEDYSATYTWELTEGDEEKEVVAKFKDKAGNVSVIVRDRIILDTEGPTNCLLKINNGDKYARDPRNLNLELYASGADEMMVSNNKDFKGGLWKPYIRHVNSWNVSLANGPKTIYVKFRDKAGNVSEVISDEIILDNGVPEVKSFKLDTDDAGYDARRRVKVTKHQDMSGRYED